MSIPRIILLNGTSSSGKTTLAKALQMALDLPFLHFSLDAFEDMIPPRTREGGPFAFDRIFPTLLSGMHSSLAAMAEAGNHLIVDHVILEDEEPTTWALECLTAIVPFEVLMVGVHCSEVERERREFQRKDRNPGLSAWQAKRMHKVLVYDVEVDTSSESTGASVAKILACSTRDAIQRSIERLL